MVVVSNTKLHLDTPAGISVYQCHSAPILQHLCVILHRLLLRL